MEPHETEMETDVDQVQADAVETEPDKIVKLPDRQIAKKTLKRVIMGIWIFAAAVLAVGVWFPENKLAFVAGEVLGSGVSTALMIHLYHCIEHELDIGESKARAHARLNSMLRYLIEIAALAGCCFIAEYISPISFLIGLFGRKIGALMVPLFFDKERTGQMTEEDREQLRNYGRLLSRKEMRELEVEGSADDAEAEGEG